MKAGNSAEQSASDTHKKHGRGCAIIKHKNSQTKARVQRFCRVECGLPRGDFNMSLDAPHVRPIQPHDFLDTQTGQPAQCKNRAQIGGGVQKFLQFGGAEKIPVPGLDGFAGHAVRFKQAMIAGQIILAGCPSEKHFYRRAPVVAVFRANFREGFEVKIDMVFREVTKGGCGKRAGKSA